MIPLRDDNPTRTVPYVVFMLIAANILAYVVDSLGGQTLARGIQIGALWDYTMIPRQVITGDPTLPAIIGNFIVPHPSPTPTWITIFTSMFLHGGLLHIGSNMLYLWIFGNNIEDVLGHFRFLLFYLAGGVAAALAHIASAPGSQVPVVGASGAIAAVLGAYIVLFPGSRVQTLVFLGFFVTFAALPAVVLLGYWFFIQIFSAAVLRGGMAASGGGVAYWAHIGGFVFGALGVLLLGGRRLVRGRIDEHRYNHNWYEG